MKKFLIKTHILLLSLLAAFPLFAQQVATTTQVLPGSAIGTTILVPVSTSGITASYGNIVIATIRVTYDPAVLTYTGLTNINTGIPTAQLSVNPAGGGVIQVNIEDPAFAGFPYPEGKSFDMQFTFLGGSSAITITKAEFLNAAFATLNAPVVNGNVSVSTDPFITVAPTTLSGFSYLQGAGPSAEQSFTVSGIFLTTSISIAASASYEVSTTSGTGYATPLTLVPTTGTVANTTIYVRLKAGLPGGNYNGEVINITSAGATPRTLTASGAVISPLLSASAMSSFGNVCTGSAAGPNSFTITGTGLAAGTVNVAALSGFTFSATPGGSYTSTLAFPETGGAFSTTVYVKFTPALVQSYNGNIAVDGGGASTVNVAASGAGTASPSAAGPITGPASLCQNTNGAAYSVAAIPNATTYLWTVPSGASIASGSGTASITVNFGTATSGIITVAGSNPCGTGTSSSLAVTLNALPVPVITGPASVCAGSSGNSYATTAGMTGYTWAVSAGGSITSGSGTNAISVTWNTAGAQTVSVNYTNAANCAAASATSYAVNVNALPVPVITGPASVCAGSAANNYATTAGMTGYTWAVSTGGSISSGAGTNAISVYWNTAGAHTVSVIYTNAAGCAAASATSYAVNVNALPVPAIAGPASVCAGSSGNSYTTSAGMTGYTWAVSAGGSIISGAGTNAISVNWNTAGAQTVSVIYTNAAGCAAASATSYAVNVNALPVPAIAGPASVCAGSSGNSYTTSAGMTGYTWAVSAGGTISSGAGTNAINVTWNTAGEKTVSVNYGNAANCFAASPVLFNVTVKATPPAPVITLAGLTLTSDAQLGNQWYKGDALIQGATNQTYNVTQNGIYSVIVTLSGCSSAVSNSINVISVGIDNVAAAKFSLYPVPNNGLFTALMVSPKAETYTIRVYNIIGSLVYEKKDILVNGSTKQVIDLRNTMPGMYTVTFTSGIKQVINKMVINPD